MLSLFMKLPVQTPFGNAFYLPRSYAAISSKPFASSHIPVTLAHSSPDTLFFATTAPQPAWNQQLPHSFYRHGGGPPASQQQFLSATSPKRTKHESASTQLQLGRDAGQSRSQMPSRHPLRTSVPPPCHPLWTLFSSCRIAIPIRTTR